MNIFVAGDLGYIYDENGSIAHLWISNERAKKPLGEFYKEFWTIKKDFNIIPENSGYAVVKNGKSIRFCFSGKQLEEFLSKEINVN